MVVEARRKKDLPAMNQYIRPEKWSKLNEGDNFLKFSKTKFMTETATILERAKERPKDPGPATYKPKYHQIDKHMGRFEYNK